MNSRLQNVAGFLLLFSIAASAAEPTSVNRSFKWRYDGGTYSLNYSFDYATYKFYRQIPRQYSNYADYTTESTYHPVIRPLARKLKSLADRKQLSEWETVNMIVKFVQSIPYKLDRQTEYPRFPIETLVDFGGDCEDSAILLAALLASLGYDVALVSPPGHMAVAIACTDCRGTFYQQRGKRYFYIETTDNAWSIGSIPRQYQGQSAKIYPVELKTDSGMLARRGNRIGSTPSRVRYTETTIVYVNGVAYVIRRVANNDGVWTYDF